MGKIDANTPIDNVGFSFRTRNTRRRAHIDTFKDLMAAYEEGNLRSIKNLGKVQYGEILAIIDSLGYRKENKVISNPYIHSRGYHVPREVEKIPIDNMNLENRLRNVLYREGYRTVGKIMRMKKESLYLIHGIGDQSANELVKAVKGIEKEGIEYFTAPDRTNELIEEDNLRTLDKRTAYDLVKRYGLKVKWIAEWYDVSISWINFAINDKTNHGNWLNREFTEEDAKNLNHMIDSNVDIYKPTSDETLYFLSNIKDDCAVLIVNDKEIKCFFLNMLPEDIQERMREERLDHLSMEERTLMTEGEIVSVLRKEYFRAYDPKKLSRYARYRGMSSEKYSRFLTGMPLITTTTTVTDERIEQFLSEYYRDGQISMPKGENCHWFRSFISRNGYTMKDVREMYGF